MVFARVQNFLTFNEKVPYAAREALYLALCTATHQKLGRPRLGAPQKRAVEALRNRGYFASLIDQNQEQIAALDEELKTMTPMIFDYEGTGRRDKVIYRSADLSASLPFLRLATDDAVISAVAHYLQGPPLIHALMVWDVNEESKEQAEMLFHVDYHGHRCLKLFIYLSDVVEGGGHHELVAGSHRPHLAREKVIFTGPAGTSWIEDTRGLHRGTPVQNRTTRRAFKVLYTVLESEKDGIEPSRDRRAFDRRLAETKHDKKLFTRMCSKIIDLGSRGS